ncbi:MAG: hypothetical protein RIQ89_1137, partial [Bacteroidota bacterium]
MSELKSKHEMMIDIVNQVASMAAKLGIVHNDTEDYTLDGRHVTIKGEKIKYFGSCSYLGLEHDPRLKAASIDAVNRYGSSFSSSRAYLSSTFYKETEELLRKMFGKPCLLVQSLTVGHMSNIPVLVKDNDAVILDNQVHDSVQNACNLLRVRNVHVEVVRHNRLDMLEERIKQLSKTHNKVWYMADGVYSMHGDLAPVKELYKLADQYEQFYLYLDDIHGMSWAGPNGTGYVLEQGQYHPKLYLTTGLTKAFGAAGGLLIYPNEQDYNLMKNVSKAFIFSIQMPPSVLGSCIASAKLHLSDEIVTLQQELQQKIMFFNQTTKKLDLPLINETNSPIMFVGVGKPDTGYNMVRRLMNKGYLINISVFPSVAYNNTGLRIPINRFNTYEDIEGLLTTIQEQLPFALEDSH